jgi:integrase
MSMATRTDTQSPALHVADGHDLIPEHARALLEAAREDRLEALYVLAVHCGLRQGELLGLRWEDVDLDAGVLRMRGTKTARSRRTVKLSQTVLEALRSHLTRQLEEIDKMGDRYQDRGLVFASEIGTPLNRYNVMLRSSRCSRKPGCPILGSTTCAIRAPRYCSRSGDTMIFRHMQKPLGMRQILIDKRIYVH